MRSIPCNRVTITYYMQYYYSYHPREQGGLKKLAKVKKLAKGLQKAKIW